MTELKEQVSEVISKTLSSSFENYDGSLDISSLLEYPPDKSMGDIALPCFKLSKTLHMAPQMIASKICEGLNAEGTFAASAVNGYLNVKISDGVYVDVVEKILTEGEDYGKGHSGDGKTMVIDYSSPNVAKPFHIGHLGSTVIGHSIKRLHEFAGYKAIGVNHLGDWGTQFGKMITAYRKWGDGKSIREGGIDNLVSLYVKFHAESETDPSLNDVARAEFTKMEQGDEENLKLRKDILDVSIAEYKKTYAKLGIVFDYYTGESFYTDFMPKQVNILREKSLLKIDDGASLVDLSEYNMPPCLILKRDGSTLYPTRDIAAAVYRKETFNFDKSVYVTSNQQILHFRQWFKVLELMGYDWYDQLVHVPYGTVSINGTKLATRTGNVVLLKDLFEKATEKVMDIIEAKNPGLEGKNEIAEAVGIGAVVFYYLTNSRIKDSDFNLDDALSFEGNTGPYVQYTYARCCSVTEKAGTVPSKDACKNYKPNETEVELCKTLSRFGEKAEEALETYEPMVITRYILDIAGGFNRFYHDCKIVTEEDEEARAFRIRLTEATKTVLGTAFGLICLKKTPKI